MSGRLRGQDGIALISAIVIVSISMALGLAMVALADNQQGSSRGERQHEASLNLTEAALQAQLFQLGRLGWPTASTNALTASCTVGSTGGSCPDASALASYGVTTSPDYQGCPGKQPWKTYVVDNGGTTSKDFFSSTQLTTQPAYDANHDGAMWVVAEGLAGCRSRRVVTQVHAGFKPVTFPRNVVAANWFVTTNNGRKVIVDTVGAYAMPESIRPPQSDYAAQAAPLQVRCAPPLPPGVTDPCLNYEVAKGQVTPPTAAKVPTLVSPMFTSEQIDSFAAIAMSYGTYYPAGTCPSNLTGRVVVIEDSTPCPTLFEGGNDQDHPGFLVIRKGTITLGGNETFYGFVYAANTQSTNGPVVSLQGTATLQGAVAIDGAGGLSAGSSATNVVYDARSFNDVRTLGSPAPVAGTWRELRPNE